MSKKKREEERRILAELDAAVKKERAGREEQSQSKEEKFHCSRCKTEMKNGVCPVCGHTMYVGMSEEERKKIRRILTVVGLGIFAVLFLVLQLK